MNKFIGFLVAACACCVLTCEAQAPATKAQQWTVIHAGKLLAVPGQAPKPEQSLILKGDKVAEVRDGYVTAAEVGSPGDDVKVIELKDKFVMPGFIDAHVHLTGQFGDGGKMLAVTWTDADYALNGAYHARQTLAAGFTTVRDLGAPNDSIFALRDAIRAGKVPGPRIVAAGTTISSTNGHGDVHGFRSDVMAVLASPTVCDGADDCRRAVREAIKRGADVIKMMATGGVLDESNTGTGQQFTDEEMKAIVETAHALNRKVAAHAHSNEGILAAVRAGVDSVEHCMWADEATLKEIKKRGIYVVPTVFPITWVGDTPEKMKNGPMKNMPPPIMKKLLGLVNKGSQPVIMTRMAIKLGVKIALGTDAGVYPHGLNGGEFEQYVKAGMSPMEAIESGTVNAADLLGLSDQIGTLEPGKDADVVAVSGDPLTDAAVLKHVDFVMHWGKVFKE